MKSRGKLIFMALLWCVFSMGALTGCAEGGDDDWNNNGGDPSGDEFCEDQDDDGYLGLTARCQRGSDCNDLDDSVNPGATEVCGDGIDNDCSNGDAPCEGYCVDVDEDGFGYGETCLGPDCDDSNPNAYPGATEICGNDVDENCDGSDLPCPLDCTDMDGDGYGPAGANSDCPQEGDDCDDNNASVNPSAEEVCNNVDDNCDGQVDECDRDDAVCSGTSAGDSCVVGVGVSCSSNEDCEAPARCDTYVSECRYPDGESCASEEECLAGYVCQGGMCSGDFCDINTCAGGFCLAEAERCVECDPNATGNGGCGSGETCSPQGFCASTLFLTDTDPVEGHPNITNEIYALSLAIADCWIDKQDADEDELCNLLVLENGVGPITEDAMESAFEDGHLTFIGPERYEALDDLWGKGFLNAKNLHWRSEPQPDTFLEYCVWYDTVRRDEVIVEKCSEFSP